MADDRAFQHLRPCETIATFSPLPYEVDFTGFMSNTVVPCWLERLRVQLITEHLGDIDLFDPHHLSVIVQTTIRYIKPVRLGDVLVGRAWVKKCLSSSWTIHFLFSEFETDVERIGAAQVGAFIDSVSFQPTRIPSQVRDHLFSF